MIGDEVTKYRSILELSYPTTEGIVKNWEDMELLLDYSFKSVHNTPNSAGPDLNERQIPHDDLSRHEPGRQSR
jgi:actin-related protein